MKFIFSSAINPITVIGRIAHKLKIKNISIVIVAMVLFFVQRPALANELEAEARTKLMNQDVSYLANMSVVYFYQHFGDDRLTELLRAIWNRDEKKYPELAWKSLSDDEVRLRYAGLWAQWIRETQKDKKQIDEIRTYVLPFRKHPNPRVRLAAVSFTVGGTDEDVAELSRIVVDDELVVAAAAVYSIVDIYGKRSKETLIALRTKVKNMKVKGVIEDALMNIEKGVIPQNKH